MTSVTGLLSRLRELNVTVQVAGEQLRLNGPPGALGPDLLAELKSRKEELVEFLRSVQDREDYAPIPVVESRSDYELSHAQKRLWVLEQFDEGHVAYNIPAAFRLRGPLDLVAFEAALAAIVRRHESFRTGFAVADGKPVQVVQDRVHFSATLVDLSHMDDREARAERYAEQEAETPFDLSAPPLLRVKVLRLNPEEHVVVFNMHHIISDGWSIAVMLKELRSLYRTYRADDGRSWTPLRVQYKDYAAWQQQLLCQADAGRERAYWHEKLSGDLPALELPADRPRPPVKTYSGDTLEFALDADATALLRDLCRQEQVTLFMALVALVKIILHRYTGQRDIIVGSPIAGRNHPDLEGQIGFYVNMLALRDVVDSGASFSSLLQQVKRTATEAYQHQNYPFDKLVDELSVSRDVGRSAIFDVAVALQNAPESELSFDGVEVEPLGNLYRKSKYDLSFSFDEMGDTLHARLEYNTDLYDRDRIVRLWDHFAQLVTSVGSTLQAGVLGQRPVGEFEILTEQETSRLRDAFNDTGADYPELATIVTLFEEQAAATPERVAVVCEGRELSYAELNERANGIAWNLREQYGVRPGDLVAVLLEPGERMIAALLGVLKSAGAYVPVDPAYPTDRIAYILDDCGARIVLTEDGPLSTHSYTHLQGLETACADVCVTPPRDPIRDVDALPTVAGADIGGMTAAGRGNPPPAARPDDTAYVIYTSGSTGRPKGCLVSHRNVVRLMRNDRFPFEFSDRDVWIMAHSYCFDFSVWEMYGALLYGGKVVVPKRSDVRDTERFLSLLKQHRVTVLNQTPGAFYSLLERELRQSEHTLAGHLRYVIFGGSRLDPARLRSWTDVYPLGDIRLVNMYGITETTVHVTFHGVRDEDVRSSSGRSPIGVPLPETTVHILDAEGRLAPLGVTGEMYVGGSGVSKGYLSRPQLTAQRFVPHRLGTGERLYRTGDLARWTPDGRLEFIGRADEQVKVRGYRIELGEIQHQLLTHPEVREALVIGRESATTGDGELVAYVVWTGDGEDGVTTELRSHLKQTLPDYMIPPYFVALSEFPLTRNGKIAVKELPPAEVRGTEAQAAPESEIEKILARVWQEVLHVTAVGVRDNFFELGGDSIKAVQIAARLRKEGLRLQLNDLFAEPMIADLAKRLEWTEDTAEQRPVTGVTPLTPIQRWFFEQDSAHRHHYNQAVMLFREAGFGADTVRAALTAITDHHDALRMVYVDETTAPADGARGVLGTVSVQIARDTGVEPFSLDVFDMTGETDAARTITEKSTVLQGGMDLASGPLVRLGLFRTGDGDHLLIALHHLVVDGVSWRILLDDFAAAYCRAEHGEEIGLPAKTDSFQFWASRLEGYANGTEILGELPFWESIVNAVTEPLPKDCVPATDSAEAHQYRHGSMGDTESVPVELTIEETDLLLRQAGRAYGTNVADLLLTALMLSLNDRFGVQTALVNLEGHGREGILDRVDVSRTVGWFTSQFPVLLEARREGFAPLSDGELSYVIRSTKEALRRIPNKGIGYGLLRYMTSDESRAGACLDVQPEICFNYLGQFDRGDQQGTFTLSEVEVGKCISEDAENPYAIAVNGLVLDRKLTLSFTYSRREYDEDTIGLLAQAFESYLLSILEHCTAKRDCEPTPSDFGDSDLSLEDLDQITALFESVEGNG